MYPISDLTAFCRRTTGDVPPKLVGASTTVIGSKMYLYGGRLVSERRMVSDIYMFDLETFHWDRLFQSPEDDIPQARYFHSADTWRNHLIIFGGMAIKPQSDNPEDLCVLNDVRLFDLSSGHWVPSSLTSGESSPPSFVPNARYAHLSSVSADRLFIIGGQDLANVWLDDVYIYDLLQRAWVQRREYSRHCGTYRSVAVTADMRVRLPQEEMRTGQSMPSSLRPAGTRFKASRSATPSSPVTPPESLVHLPYSASPTDEYPCDIFLFSNYNFTDVQRELEVFSPLSDGDFTVSDRSAAMTGTSFPPGLRFPTGAILGTFFIVAGTYLSQTYQSFSIWALDLINMTWSRIDPGSALATGSWFRSCLWPAANRFLVFGNRHGNLVEDYNRRLLSWDHVTCIDLEAFGIYQPPPLVLDIPSQELGLAAFEEGTLADFEIICDDGRKIRCSRRLLEERWPWFKEQRKLFVQAAQRETEAMEPIPQHVPLPELPGACDGQEPRPDPRLTPRSFNLSEPYPITLALVQYFYSMALITPLQHAPAVLSQLLLLSSTYELVHLQSLVKHAMHRALSYATSVGIYGVSTLCSCRSLQIRALRVVMAYSQKRPGGGRSRADRDGPPGSRNGDANGNGSGGPGGPSDTTTAARPRGLSDASYLRGPSDGNGASQIGYRAAASTPKPGDRSDTSSTLTMRPRAMSEILLSKPFPSSSPQLEGTGQSGVSSEAQGSAAAPPQSPELVITPTSRPSSMKSPEQSRPSSIVSLATERDMHEIAELMTPTAQKRSSSQEITKLIGTRPRTNSLLDMYRSMESSVSRPSLPASSASSVRSAIYAESEADYFSDDLCESVVYSPTQASYPAFHLPLSPRRTAYDSDSTPSLRTSTSLSSLSTTPSLSRASSFRRSPPLSPTTAALATPTDLAPLSPQSSQFLDVIEEAQSPEEEPSPNPFYADERASASLPVLDLPWSFLTRDGTHVRSRVDSRLTITHRDSPSSPETIIVASPIVDSPGRGAQSPKSHRIGGRTFSRLFGKDAKKKQAKEGSTEGGLSHWNGSAINLSLAKAEEKKRKRLAEKERVSEMTLDKLRGMLDMHIHDRTDSQWDHGGYPAV